MWVCENCHEADKYIIDCMKPQKNHKNIAMGECDICGKVTEIGFTCELYTTHEEGVKNAKNVEKI